MTSSRQVWVGGSITIQNLQLDDGLMVHCNMGEDGDLNGWYIFGIFETDIGKRWYDPIQRSIQTATNYSLNTAMMIPN